MKGPLPGFLWPLTRPLSWAYRAGVSRRNRGFDRHPERAHSLPVPVISIGNITTGGTGKTPFVNWVVQELLKTEHRPVIAMRGYGARPGELSDEETEHMQRMSGRGVEVIVHPDRHHALSGYLAAHREVDCVVLDDGFQHRQLHRSLDVVLIDATRNTFNDRLLPAGHLREPLNNLRRANAIIITRATGEDESISASIKQHHGHSPIAWSRHDWSDLDLHDAEGTRKETTAWLHQRKVVTLLGIGNPEAMRRQVEQAGATIVRDIPVRDHQPYDPRNPRESHLLARIRDASRETEALVTTGKDWVKLQPLIEWEQWAVPIVVPQLELSFLAGEVELIALLRRTIDDFTPRA